MTSENDKLDSKDTKHNRKEAWLWSLFALLTFLLSHSTTYADWPLSLFAATLTICLIRLVFLTKSSKSVNP